MEQSDQMFWVSELFAPQASCSPYFYLVLTYEKQAHYNSGILYSAKMVHTFQYGKNNQGR